MGTTPKSKRPTPSQTYVRRQSQRTAGISSPNGANLPGGGNPPGGANPPDRPALRPRPRRTGTVAPQSVLGPPARAARPQTRVGPSPSASRPPSGVGSQAPASTRESEAGRRSITAAEAGGNGNGINATQTRSPRNVSHDNGTANIDLPGVETHIDDDTLLVAESPRAPTDSGSPVLASPRRSGDRVGMQRTRPRDGEDGESLAGKAAGPSASRPRSSRALDVNRLKRRTAASSRPDGSSSVGIQSGSRPIPSPNEQSVGEILPKTSTRPHIDRPRTTSGRRSIFLGGGTGSLNDGRGSPSGVVRSSSPHVSAEFVNNLKKEMEDLKRDKMKYSELADRYKTDIKNQAEELSVCRVQLDSLQRELGEIQCSQGGNGKKGKTSTRRASFTELATLFVEEGVAAEHVGAFQDVSKQIPRLAQYLVRESCPRRLEDLIGRENWFPNNTLSEGEECRDWRGRVVFIDGPSDTHQIDSPTGLHPLGAIFMDTTLSAGNGCSVFRGCVPLCLMEQAHKAEFFTSSDSLVRRLVGDYVIFHATASRPSLSASSQRNLMKLGSSSHTLLNQLNSVVQNGVGHRKGAARREFFTQLWYGKIISSCGASQSVDVKSARAEEERVASGLLLKESCPGQYDTSWWRRATFPEICCPGTSSSAADVSSEREGSSSDGVDRLFKTSASRAALHAWRGYSVSFEDDASLMSLIRLDAWMTVVFMQMGRRTATQAVKGGGHTTWMKRQFRHLVPIAAESLMKEISGVLRSSVVSSGVSAVCYDEELVVCDGDDVEEILSNENREYTQCFRYPRNNHYYVAVLPEVFQGHVCGWFGKVRDCYIGYSPQAGGKLCPFTANGIMSYVHESDEEDEMETSRPVRRSLDDGAADKSQAGSDGVEGSDADGNGEESLEVDGSDVDDHGSD